MSHNVIKSLSINTKKRTYNYSIASNNVRPKTYTSIKDNNLDFLLYDLSTGNSQYHGKANAKLLLVCNLAYKYKEIYGGDWDDRTDLYHENSPRSGIITEKYLRLNREMLDEYSRIVQSENKYIVRVKGALVTGYESGLVRGTYSNGEKPCEISELELNHIQSRYNDVKFDLVK